MSRERLLGLTIGSFALIFVGSLINVWVDPDAYAPGTMNQTMYK